MFVPIPLFFSFQSASFFLCLFEVFRFEQDFTDMLFLTVINRAVKLNMCSQACILSAKYQSEPEHIKTEDVF